MLRSVRTRAAALALCLLAACGAGSEGDRPSTPSGDARPNLLLISIDTLRPDRLGCYGHDRPTSPTLDRLAAEGLLFEDVTAASPWTLPSHASMLTGLYPSHHGVKQHTLKLPESIPSLAEVLSDAGYQTLAVVNSHNVSERYGLSRGFDRFQYVGETADDGQIPNMGPVVLKAAERMLSKRDGRPFFLFLHLYDVHTDFVVRPPYRRQFVRPYEGARDGSTGQLVEIRRRGGSLSEEDVRFLFDLYDAEIRQLDDLLGVFFGKLYAEGLFESTVIAVTSDHGEEFFEHGSVLHGRTYYQEIVAIPWLLRVPGLAPELAGRRIAAPVHLVDVAPTLLGLVGVRPERPMDGIDLSALVLGGDQELPDRLLFSEGDHLNSEPDIRRMVRTPRYKLLYDRLTERAELFDLERDPLELEDRLGAEPELGRTMLERLEAFMAGEAEADTIEAPDAETLRQLEQLGYGGD